MSRTDPGSVDGFRLLRIRTHRIPERLGEIFARRIAEWGLPTFLGSLCRPDSQIGSRICQSPVEGVQEYYYVNVGSPACTKADADGGIRDLLCSVGRLGHIPLVGATAASLVTTLAAILLSYTVPAEAWRASMLCLALISTGICTALETWAHSHYLADDPREVVLDEVAGMSLALAMVGPNLPGVLAAFIAFRFFDIVKPGIHWVEKRAWRGTIVWDDLLAGLYAGASILAFRAALRSLC